MERICSASNLHADFAAVCYSLISGRTGRHHIYGFDRFGRWDRRREKLNPGVCCADAIDTDVCAARTGFVGVDYWSLADSRLEANLFGRHQQPARAMIIDVSSLKCIESFEMDTR